jgi:hypothetical protein
LDSSIAHAICARCSGLVKGQDEIIAPVAVEVEVWMDMLLQKGRCCPALSSSELDVSWNYMGMGREMVLAASCLWMIACW